MIPLSLATEEIPFQIDDAGQWLVLSDVHIPHHDNDTVRLALEEAKRRRVVGVLLNGDILDSAQISSHERHASAIKYRDEIQMGIDFLTHIRAKFPKARIVFKEGNHESRLDRYIINRADALEGLDGINLPSFLKMDDLGVEYVSGSVIRLGKLNVIHGHEYRGGGGVNPARWLYLQAHDCGLCGHFHRTSEHHERDITGYNVATFASGCACNLFPHWMPLNRWNHGFTTVALTNDGGFKVKPHRVVGGEIV